MITANIQSTYGAAVRYFGFISLSSSPQVPLAGVSGLSAEGSFDGGAPTSSGLTVVVDPYGRPGYFQLDVTGEAMQVDEQAVITVSSSDPGTETFELTIRTGAARELAYGIPIDRLDCIEGGNCEETGLLMPASRLKHTIGREGMKKRVGDFVDFNPED